MSSNFTGWLKKIKLISHLTIYLIKSISDLLLINPVLISFLKLSNTFIISDLTMKPMTRLDKNEIKMMKIPNSYLL